MPCHAVPCHALPYLSQFTYYILLLTPDLHISYLWLVLFRAVLFLASQEFWSLGLGQPYPISGIHGTGIGDLLGELLSYYNLFVYLFWRSKWSLFSVFQSSACCAHAILSVQDTIPHCISWILLSIFCHYYCCPTSLNTNSYSWNLTITVVYFFSILPSSYFNPLSSVLFVTRWDHHHSHAESHQSVERECHKHRVHW